MNLKYRWWKYLMHSFYLLSVCVCVFWITNNIKYIHTLCVEFMVEQMLYDCSNGKIEIRNNNDDDGKKMRKTRICEWTFIFRIFAVTCLFVRLERLTKTNFKGYFIK